MSTLKERVLEHNREVKTALETIMAALNNGQRKKLAKDPTVAALLERYGIDVTDKE